MITSIKHGLIMGLIVQSVSLGAGIGNLSLSTAKIVWRIVWIVVCYTIYVVLEEKERKNNDKS